jgi:hypothetical protein
MGNPTFTQKGLKKKKEGEEIEDKEEDKKEEDWLSCLLVNLTWLMLPRRYTPIHRSTMPNRYVGPGTSDIQRVRGRVRDGRRFVLRYLGKSNGFTQENGRHKNVKV